MRNKPSFGLILTIFLLLLLSSLSIFIFEFKSLSKQNIVKEKLSYQARLHLDSTKIFITNLDLNDLSKSCINNLYIEENSFNINIHFAYITKRVDCEDIISSQFENNNTNGMAIATIEVQSIVKDYINIRVVKIVKIKL